MCVQYCAGVQYHEGYHDACGRYLEYCGGCSVLWEKNLLLVEYLHGTQHPHSIHDIPTCIIISHTVLKLQKMVSPMVLMIPPMVLMIPPMVLMISNHVHHDISHGTDKNLSPAISSFQNVKKYTSTRPNRLLIEIFTFQMLTL